MSSKQPSAKGKATSGSYASKAKSKSNARSKSGSTKAKSNSQAQRSDLRTIFADQSARLGTTPQLEEEDDVLPTYPVQVLAPDQSEYQSALQTDQQAQAQSSSSSSSLSTSLLASNTGRLRQQQQWQANRGAGGGGGGSASTSSNANDNWMIMSSSHTGGSNVSFKTMANAPDFRMFDYNYN